MNGSSAYPEAAENGTGTSLCLPVLKDVSNIAHREPPSCHRFNFLISKAELMMIHIYGSGAPRGQFLEDGMVDFEKAVRVK